MEISASRITVIITILINTRNKLLNKHAILTNVIGIYSDILMFAANNEDFQEN